MTEVAPVPLSGLTTLRTGGAPATSPIAQHAHHARGDFSDLELAIRIRKKAN